MTREEAIRCLSVYSSTNGSGLCTDEQHYEAKQIAIKALEHPKILCSACKYWDSESRLCFKHRIYYGSTNWDVEIYRKTKATFYCADAEPKEVEE
jgi:hypothetical protein